VALIVAVNRVNTMRCVPVRIAIDTRSGER
jgi:hypothetical protein